MYNMWGNDVSTTPHPLSTVPAVTAVDTVPAVTVPAVTVPTHTLINKTIDPIIRIYGITNSDELSILEQDDIDWIFIMYYFQLIYHPEDMRVYLLNLQRHGIKKLDELCAMSIEELCGLGFKKFHACAINLKRFKADDSVYTTLKYKVYLMKQEAEAKATADAIAAEKAKKQLHYQEHLQRMACKLDKEKKEKREAKLINQNRTLQSKYDTLRAKMK